MKIIQPFILPNIKLYSPKYDYLDANKITMMSEELLHFVWKFGLFENYLIKGIEIGGFQIINPGTHNKDAGPDFFNAKIKSGETIWIGNIEIHIKSSDWFRHGHHNDKAYNNVILQVVVEHDKEIQTESGRNIPVMEIVLDKCIEIKYEEFKTNNKWIPCQNDILTVNDFKTKMWLGSVLIERLNEKSQYINKILELNKNSWEETFYQLLARNFGFKVNAEPFEWLAKSLQLKYLAKHQSSLLQIEALLFGQAGFLNARENDDLYYTNLKKEYEFLRGKFGLIPLEKHLWKFMRLRPPNFPTIRISQFAAIISKSKSLFSKIIESENLAEIKQLFEVKASENWDNRYTFEKISDKKEKILGTESINNILINTIIPLIFAYGLSTNNEMLKERAINFLEEMKPETNHIIKAWREIGIVSKAAFYSQALLQQKKNYCEKSKCLECGIGIEIIKNQLIKSKIL